MRVLFVAGKMPSEESTGTMAPVARQIASLNSFLSVKNIIEVSGLPFAKHLKAMHSVRAMCNEYDVVHAHYGICGFTAVISSRIPVVISMMGSDIQFSPDSPGIAGRIRASLEHSLSRFAAGKAAAVIVKSRGMEEVLSPINSIVIPNGVDLMTFLPIKKEKARAIFDLDQEARIVLFGGNPSDMNKNFPLAEKTLETAIEKLGEDIQCIPLVGVKPEKVPLLINACDCMLFTSLQEGSPNVVKEAMACNTPVVSVPVGDTEFLLENVEGCRICGYDSEELGAAIADVLSSDMKTNGRESLINKKLDMQSISQRILDVYRKVLDQREISQSSTTVRG